MWCCGCSHSFVSQIVGDDGLKITIVVSKVVSQLDFENYMQMFGNVGGGVCCVCKWWC